MSKAKSISILEIGSLVTINLIGVQGYIVSAILKDGSVTYQVSYFDDNKVNLTNEFYDFELSAVTTKDSEPIGFKHKKKS